MITLTTDFGPGAYAGAMRGAILAVHPEARIVDVTHDVPRHDVRAGAFILERVLPLFPPAVHVAVVDPGVGTARRGLVIETPRGTLVGPDNGLLMPAARALGAASVYELTERSLWRSWVSRTFHGRDVFGPVAAHIDKGVPAGRAGREITDPVEGGWPAPRVEGAFFHGTVVLVDAFGNAVTDIPMDLWKGRLAPGDRLELVCGSGSVPLERRETYGEAAPAEAIVLVGSFDTLEIAVRGASAAAKLGLKAGDAVKLRGPA